MPRHPPSSVHLPSFYQNAIPCAAFGIQDSRFTPFIYRHEPGGPETFFPNSTPGFDPSEIGPHNVLSISAKIRSKQGLIFKNCPMWKELLEDDRDQSMNRSYHNSTSSSSKMSKSQFEDHIKKLDESKKNEKEKRKHTKDPSVKDVREHFRNIIQFHEKIVEENYACSYPLPGVFGDLHDDDEKEHDRNENNSSPPHSLRSLFDEHQGFSSGIHSSQPSKPKRGRGNSRSSKARKK